MCQFSFSKHKFLLLLLSCISTAITTQSQTIQNPQPTWWFGASAAANFNVYRGTTQMLKKTLPLLQLFTKEVA